MGCLRIQRGAGGGVQIGLSPDRSVSRASRKLPEEPRDGLPPEPRPRAVNGTLRRAPGWIAAGLYGTVGNVTAHPI